MVDSVVKHVVLWDIQSYWTATVNYLQPLSLGYNENKTQKYNIYVQIYRSFILSQIQIKDKEQKMRKRQWTEPSH
jgi:hypothetical protein